MSATLALAGGLMGLAGSLHCAAMCGPVVAGLDAGLPASPSAGRGPARVVPILAVSGAAAPAGPVAARTPSTASFWPGAAARSWLLGRIVGYALAGAVVASSVAALARLGSLFGWLRPFWILAHLALLVLGLALLFMGRQPAALVRALESLAQTLGGQWAWRAAHDRRPEAAATSASPQSRVPKAFSRASGWSGLFGLGVAWVLVPCGLLQSALVTAALASTPVAGAAVMGAFAIASSLGLMAAPWLRAAGSQGLRIGPARWRIDERLATRAAGALLAAAAVWSLWRLMSEGLVAALCVA